MNDLSTRTPLSELGIDGTTLVTYAPGDLIRAANTATDWIAQVREGRVTVRATAEDQSERLFSQRRVGAWLGLEALADRVSPCSLVAHTQVVLAQVPIAALRTAIASNPAVANHVIVATLDEAHTISMEQVLLRAPAEERIRTLFGGQVAAPSWGEPDALTRQDLARLLNMRPETLSRLSTKLRPRNRRRNRSSES